MGIFSKNKPVNETQINPMNTQETVVYTQKIGKEQIKKADEILERYRQGKINLEKRIVENENWWKLQQWRSIDDNGQKEKPSSAWLFNTVISKHADAVEAYPTFNCLAREENDKAEAASLSSIIPVVLEQNAFQDTYSDEEWCKIKFGTGVYGVFWNPDKLNGLGDIEIEKVDLLNIYCQPGIDDIQKSRNVFRTRLMENDFIEEIYPETKGKLGSSATYMNKYEYDDNVDTSDSSVIVDWYYHKYINKKQVLHYVRYVNDIVLYATENEPEYAEKGLYDHGLYPFVFDVLFPVEGSPFGFGYVDVCKNPQKYIDELGQAFVINAKFASKPRYFKRSDGGINEDEFANPDKMFVESNRSLGDDSLKQITVTPLNDIYVAMRNNLIQEMKETSGNRDVNNGGTASGVTAASAIAAMQEQSGKTSRDSTQNSYRAYEKIINLCIELIRQFYDIPRQFRITGDYGKENYVKYSNVNLKPQAQKDELGNEMGYRLPVFDLKISSQKQNAYSKMSQNELALQFYNLGFFNPEQADQTLMTLDMMDFDGKEMILNKISEFQTTYESLVRTQQLCLALCEKLDRIEGSNLAESYAMSVMNESGQIQIGGNSELIKTDSMGQLDEENKIVSDARAQANNSTQPR